MSKCDHDHQHGHHHHHHHHAVQGRLGFAFALNLGFAFIELIGGYLTNSVAVMSDAIHDFGDAAALGMAWVLERKSIQSHDAEYTYGYRRLSVGSALFTGIILSLGSVYVVWASIARLLNPEPVQTKGMVALALLGVAVNGVAYWRISRGQSLNEKMLSWHFIEDLAGWVLVLIGAIVMLFGDFPWIDPVLGLMMSCWILWNVVRNLKASLRVIFQGTPHHLKEGEAETWMQEQKGVADIHHVHIWSMDGESHILTAHLVVEEKMTWPEIHELKVQLKKALAEKFQIREATFEIEKSGDFCTDPKHAS